MTENEAYALLPADAAWSSSFGYPGNPGFTEYHRTPDGRRFVISNGAGDDWTCAPVEITPALLPASIELTEIGEQYVIPGCERKNVGRNLPKQGGLWD